MIRAEPIPIGPVAHPCTTCAHELKKSIDEPCNSCSNGSGWQVVNITKIAEPFLIPGTTAKADPVNHPQHYTSHPSGVECIQITEHMGFNLGNAVKYIWRADLKADAIEDMKKAVWYIERELKRRGAA